MTATKPTYCRICEAACGLLVDNDARGKAVHIRPDREHPVSAGFACAKGTRFLEVANHPDRLQSPMLRRADGSLEKLDWDAAIASLGTRLRAIVDRHGPNAVALYAGNPIAFNALGSVAMFQFVRAIGTRNFFSASSQDCNNKFAGSQIVHGSPVIHPLADFDRADLAVMFGTNPLVSQSSFIHLEGGSKTFDRLMQRGGEIVWVDPRETESARRWGSHLAIKPGTDIWLMLALLELLRDRRTVDPRVEGLERLLELAAREGEINRAGEITGLGAAAIRALATRIRNAPRTAFHMSVGVNMGPFGTLAYVALQALAHVSGNFDRAGGIVFHPLAPAAADAMRALGVGVTPQTSRIGGFPSVMDVLPGSILADEITTPGDGQIRALIVVAGDPLRSIPGEARLREAFGTLELLACVDLFENETGRLAHALLPTTTWLERWDIATTTAVLQHGALLQSADPVMDPPAEVRPEAWILSRLSKALGHRTRANAALALPFTRFMPRIRGGIPMPRPRPGSYLGRGPRTPGHRVRFWDASLDGEEVRLRETALALARSEFVLISRRRRIGHNGWLHGGSRDGDTESAAWMSAQDLERIGVADGDRIEIRTDAGRMRIEVRSKAGLRPGMVVVPHGLSGAGANVNALIPSGAAATEFVSGQHRMTGIAVRIAPEQ